MCSALFTPEKVDLTNAIAPTAAPTYGQCGKIFSHPDNLMKHLQHCTGYRPQLPQQQQKHTTAASPKLCVYHQYTSMGGTVERYNINMQETLHLDHLLTALHLLPTMTQFRTKHHAYKFQVAITIVCHK